MILAQDLKKTADEFNATTSAIELDKLLKSLQDKAINGSYEYTHSGSLRMETLKALQEFGYVVNGGGITQPEYNISWKTTGEGSLTLSRGLEPKPEKLFYKDGIIGDGRMSKQAYVDYVNTIIDRFENVSWGVDGDLFSTGFTDVVVVFQEGIRGPADWFYLNKEHKWAHGRYTTYKETFTNAEFLEYISKILESNIKYKNK